MLDLDHLSRQTMGNRSLEREVLALFSEQAEGLIDRLRASAPGDERREVAHLLAGSAAAIGAFEVVTLAKQVEASEGAVDADIEQLIDVVRKTRTFIIERLGQ